MEVSYKEEGQETNWANGDFEQTDMNNSRDQARILEEMEEAMKDMAELISMHTSTNEFPEVGAVDIAAPEQSHLELAGEPTADGYEIESSIMALLTDIENATTLGELEAIHEKFTGKSQLMRARISQLKKREAIEAYLSLVASLKMLGRQIESLRGMSITQINGRLIAEQITSRLAANQTVIRLAAERVLQAARTMINQNIMKQLQVLQVALEAAIKSQRTLSANEVSMQQQLMMKLLDQVKRAQDALQKNRLSIDQMQRMAEVLQKNSTLLQSQLQLRISQLQAQMKTATDSVRNLLQQQITAAMQLSAKLAELRAMLNVQNALLSRAAEAERSRDNPSQLVARLNERMQSDFTRSLMQQNSELNRLAAQQAELARQAEIARNSQKQQTTAEQSMRNLDVAVLNAERARQADIMAAQLRTESAVTSALQSNLAITNPAITNPAITNPALTRPAIDPAIANPSLANPALTRPELTNPAIHDPALHNPALTNPELTKPAIDPVALQPELRQPDVYPIEKNPELRLDPPIDPILPGPPKPEPVIKTPCQDCGGGKICCTGQLEQAPPITETQKQNIQAKAQRGELDQIPAEQVKRYAMDKAEAAMKLTVEGANRAAEGFKLPAKPEDATPSKLDGTKDLDALFGPGPADVNAMNMTSANQAQGRAQ